MKLRNKSNIITKRNNKINLYSIINRFSKIFLLNFIIDIKLIIVLISSSSFEELFIFKSYRFTIEKKNEKRNTFILFKDIYLINNFENNRLAIK